MPDAAEVVPLVLQLLHLDDLREAVEPFDERILDRRAHAPGEGHELRRRERLVAEEHDQVLEEGAANRFDDSFRQVFPEVYALDLGAQGPGDSADLHAYCSTFMLALRMI